MNLLDLGNEIYGYTSRLPNASLTGIKDSALEIWKNRAIDTNREEWGTFQVFDSKGNSFFKGDIAKELELNLNEKFLEEGYPIKVSITQINLNTPFYKIPTLTYEVVVLGNALSEAQDPLIDWIIENRQELEYEGN